MNLPADFSDRLSPMLVKELRQGMRTNLFTAAFILLQVFMVLSLMISAAGTKGGGDVGGGFFWMFIVITLLGVMPVRGFNALHRENQLNTMDLIEMTRLSAWRITWGKWLALVSQTLLLVSAIVPYIVLRYYLGGINFVGELLSLLMICLLSMLLTAVSVGFSAFPSLLLRGAVAVGMLFLLLWLVAGGFVFSSFGGGGSAFGDLFSSFDDPEFWWWLFAMVLTMTYAGYFFLDLGASRIAPESANYATRKRLIGLGLVIVVLVLPLIATSIDFEVMYVIATFVLVAVWLDAITEKAALVPSVFRPFLRRGWYRLGMPFLTPGWHTGVRFVIVSGLIAAALMAVNPAAADSGDATILQDIDFLTVGFSVVGVVLFPLTIILLFFHAVTFSPYFFGLYLLIQLCAWLLTAMIGAVSESGGDVGEILYYCVPIPSVILVASDSFGAMSETYLLIASVVGVVLCVFICAMRARLLNQRTRTLIRQIQAETDTTVPAS